MSESLTQLYLSNPALATAIRRQQAGQSLVNEGMSTAPTGPWGALARLAQAYVGTRDVNKAEQDIKDYGEQSRADMNNFMSMVNGGGQSPAGSMPSSVPPPTTGVPGSYTASVEKLEGTGQNPLSSASGVGQFTTGTWMDYAKNNPERFSGMDPQQILAMRDNPEVGRDAIKWLAGRNAPILAQSGVQPTNGALALAHFLGPKAAAAVWQADPNTPIASVLQTAIGPEQTQAYLRANPTLSAATAGTLTTKYRALDGGAAYSGGDGASSGGNGGYDPVATAERYRRLAIYAAASPNPQIKAMAQTLGQMASQALQTNRYVPQPRNGVAGQLNLTTNEWKPDFTNTATTFTTENGDVYQNPPGGGAPVLVHRNPTGITGQGAEASAERVLSTLAPKVRDGTATPQEQSQYAQAAQGYIRPEAKFDTTTGKWIMLPQRSLPPGYPMPTAWGGQGAAAPAQPGAVAPAQPGAAPAAQPGAAPAAQPGAAPAAQPGAAPPAQPPQTFGGAQELTPGGFHQAEASKVTAGSAKGMLDEAIKQQAEANTGAPIRQTAATIRSMLDDVRTGKLAEQAINAGAWLTSLGVPPETVKSITGSSTSQAEILRKALFQLSTGAVRGMGAREPGSVIQLFTTRYPNLSDQNLTIDAMSRLLESDQQYKEDAANSRVAHLQNSVDEFGKTGKFRGAEGYQPPDAYVYQAAALAAGGMPYNVWTHGLSNEQQTEALRLASKIWPDAAALDRSGRRVILKGSR